MQTVHIQGLVCYFGHWNEYLCKISKLLETASPFANIEPSLTGLIVKVLLEKIQQSNSNYRYLFNK